LSEHARVEELQKTVNAAKEVRIVLEEVLALRGRSADFKPETALLGAIPELDSMAVVGVLNALEERFGFTVEDDEVDGATFRTFGSLVAFVEQKLRG
jgi:acyl carrier protein